MADGPDEMAPRARQPRVQTKAIPGQSSKVKAEPERTPLVELFEEKAIRILGTVEDPLFRAADVAAHIDDSHNYTQAIGKYALGVYKQKVEGGPIKQGERSAAWYLTEAGLYKYLLQAKGERAEKFQQFVYQLLKEERKRTVDAIHLALKIEQTKNAQLQESEARLYKAANDARELAARVTKENAKLRKAKYAAEDAAFLRSMGRAHLIKEASGGEESESEDSEAEGSEVA